MHIHLSCSAVLAQGAGKTSWSGTSLRLQQPATVALQVTERLLLLMNEFMQGAQIGALSSLMGEFAVQVGHMPALQESAAAFKSLVRHATWSADQFLGHTKQLQHAED